MVRTLQVFEAVSRGVSFLFQKEHDELTAWRVRAYFILVAILCCMGLPFAYSYCLICPFYALWTVVFNV